MAQIFHIETATPGAGGSAGPARKSAASEGQGDAFRKTLQDTGTAGDPGRQDTRSDASERSTDSAPRKKAEERSAREAADTREPKENRSESGEAADDAPVKKAEPSKEQLPAKPAPDELTAADVRPNSQETSRQAARTEDGQLLKAAKSDERGRDVADMVDRTSAEKPGMTREPGRPVDAAQLSSAEANEQAPKVAATPSQAAERTEARTEDTPAARTETAQKPAQTAATAPSTPDVRQRPAADPTPPAGNATPAAREPQRAEITVPDKSHADTGKMAAKADDVIPGKAGAPALRPFTESARSQRAPASEAQPAQQVRAASETATPDKLTTAEAADIAHEKAANRAAASDTASTALSGKLDTSAAVSTASAGSAQGPDQNALQSLTTAQPTQQAAQTQALSPQLAQALRTQAVVTAGPGDVVDIVQHKLAGNDAPDRVTVQLDPPELGRVSIDFKFDAQGIQHITVTGETPEALKHIRQLHYHLTQALEQHGLSGQDMSFQQQFARQDQQQGFGNAFSAYDNGGSDETLPEPDMTALAGRAPVRTSSAGLDLKL